MAVKSKNELKLVKVEYSNFKKLTVSKDFPEDANAVEVSGHNGAGKSSFIDGIYIALTGQNIPKEPIQLGKTQATISTIIKDEDAVYEAKLVFKRQKDGSVKREFTLLVDEILHKGNKARDLLNQKLESVVFDIFGFVDQKPAEKKITLEKIFNLDFSDIDGKKDKHNADILELDNKLKSLNDQLNLLELPEGESKYEHIDVSELSKKLSEAKDHNSKIESKQGDLDRAVAAIEKTKLDIADLQKALERQEEVKTKLEAELKDQEAIDITDIQTKLDSAESNNKIVENFAKQEEFVDKIQKIEDAKGQLRDAIGLLEQERVKRIKEASLPEGLEFENKEVRYKGLPLDESNMSTAELVRVGIEILVAMNPRLKIARIKEASLLDDKTKAVVQKAVSEHGILPFYEIVNNSDLAINIAEAE